MGESGGPGPGFHPQFAERAGSHEGDARFVALGAGRVDGGAGVHPGEGGQHAPHHAAVDGADDGMLGGGGAERTVVADDRQHRAAGLGVGREPVGGERIGYGVQGGAERALTVIGRLRALQAEKGEGEENDL